MKNTSLNFLWRDPDLPGRFPSAVSLHAHSRHSRETMRYVGSYKREYLLLRLLLKVAERQLEGAGRTPLRLSRIGWNPPLSAREVADAEQAQIQRLGLRAMVSLTDHDTIEGNLELQTERATASFPVSFEWTVPFGPTVFHLGVHNLNGATARQVAGELLNYSARPEPGRLHDVLALVDGQPDALLVLNHPLWDGLSIGQQGHREALRTLLSRHGAAIHALELNGYRPWSENQEVLELARAWNKPVVSGGDRHGVEPNVLLNLTRAETFTEFVAEVRCDGLSHVLFLPRYREPLRVRWLETAWDYFRAFPSPSGPPLTWKERFFYGCEDGTVRPLGELASRASRTFVGSALVALRLSLSQTARPALRWVLADPVGLRS
jgi:hypothetical protein